MVTGGGNDTVGGDVGDEHVPQLLRHDLSMYAGFFSHSSTDAQYAQLSCSFKQAGDSEGVTVGNDDTVGGDVLAIRGSKHSPHSAHTSLA